MFFIPHTEKGRTVCAVFFVLHQLIILNLFKISIVKMVHISFLYLHVTPPKRVASSFGRGYKIFEPDIYYTRQTKMCQSSGGGSHHPSCADVREQRLRYSKSGIPHTLRAKSIHQVLPMLSECDSKNSFYICIVIPARKDSSPGTRSRSPPWPSMIFRTEESPIPWSADVPFRERNVFPSCKARPS